MERSARKDTTHFSKATFHSGFKFIFNGSILGVAHDATGEDPEFTQAFIDSKVDYEILMGYLRAIVIYRDETSFGMVVVSTTLDNSVKLMKYHWDRQLLGIPKMTDIESTYWQGWIPVLLMSDLVNGSTTFNDGFRKSLCFLIQECSRKTLGGHHLVRDLPRTDTTFSLKDNVYKVRVGETVRCTSDFSSISEHTMRRMMGSAVIKGAC